MAVNRRTLALLRQLATRVGGTTDDNVRALTRRWLAAWDTLTPAWQQAITAVLDEYAATGVWPAGWRIARIEAVARAQQHTEHSLTTLMTEAAVTTAAAAAAVSATTVAAEPLVIASQMPPTGQAATVAGVAAAAAATAVAAALATRQTRIGGLHRAAIVATVDAVRRAFLRPPAVEDPDRAAVELTDRARGHFDGGLTRAATIARTELVDTYRTTSALIQASARPWVTGWAWCCACDLRSCPACWAMHGTRHDLAEPGPLGHGGCRCTRLPLVGDADLPTAEGRFRRLSRRDQARILGPARLALYRSGRIGWADLARPRATPGWRTSYIPTPVRDLQRLADLHAA